MASSHSTSSELSIDEQDEINADPDADIEVEIEEITGGPPLNESSNDLGSKLDKWRVVSPEFEKAAEKRRRNNEAQRKLRQKKKQEKDALKRKSREESDEDVQLSRPAKKKRSTKKIDGDSDEEESDDGAIIAYIQIRKDVTPAPSTSRSRKPHTAIPQFSQHGPIFIPFSVTFDSFLQLLSQALPCPIANINQSTMYYQAQVPKNSSELPVGNAAAFKAMLQSFSKKKSSSNMSIWVRLDKPIYCDEAFWDTGEGISDQHFDYSTVEAPDSSLTSTLGAQKASFDEASKPHLQILRETYPVGNKPVFGTNIRVFTNSTGDSWELNDMRLNVWASHMARKTAGVDEHHPPSSTWFDHGNRIKITPTPSVPPALPPYPLATTSAPVPSLPPAQPDFRDRLLDIMLLKLMGGDVHASLLSATSVATSTSAPLPPSLPTSPACLLRISLEAFCNHYGISEIDQERLAELEYRPGNPAIESLEAAEWTAVGFKRLSSAEIVNTHKRFLKDVKTGLWNHILS